MRTLVITFAILVTISQSFASPKGPTGSKRWPIVFVPQLRAGGGFTTLIGTTFETAEVSTDLSIFYLRNHIVAGINAEYSYTNTYHRGRGESEVFNRAEGSAMLGVYFNDGSKMLGGYTPYTQLKSMASLDVYKGTGFTGAIHWMVDYPFQIVLFAKQNTYSTKVDKMGATTELTGDQKILQFIAGIGVGYEF